MFKYKTGCIYSQRYSLRNPLYIVYAEGLIYIEVSFHVNIHDGIDISKILVLEFACMHTCGPAGTPGRRVEISKFPFKGAVKFQ